MYEDNFTQTQKPQIREVNIVKPYFETHQAQTQFNYSKGTEADNMKMLAC